MCEAGAGPTRKMQSPTEVHPLETAIYIESSYWGSKKSEQYRIEGYYVSGE